MAAGVGTPDAPTADGEPVGSNLFELLTPVTGKPLSKLRGRMNLKNSVAHLIRISEEQSERFYRLDGGQRVLQVGAATLPDRAGI